MIYKNMLICYDCGTHLMVRGGGETLEVYDSEEDKWLRECPYCEGGDFYAAGREYVIYSK